MNENMESGGRIWEGQGKSRELKASSQEGTWCANLTRVTYRRCDLGGNGSPMLYTF